MPTPKHLLFALVIAALAGYSVYATYELRRLRPAATLAVSMPERCFIEDCRRTYPANTPNALLGTFELRPSSDETILLRQAIVNFSGTSDRGNISNVRLDISDGSGTRTYESKRIDLDERADTAEFRDMPVRLERGAKYRMDIYGDVGAVGCCGQANVAIKKPSDIWATDESWRRIETTLMLQGSLAYSSFTLGEAPATMTRYSDPKLCLSFEYDSSLIRPEVHESVSINGIDYSLWLRRLDGSMYYFSLVGEVPPGEASGSRMIGEEEVFLAFGAPSALEFANAPLAGLGHGYAGEHGERAYFLSQSADQHDPDFERLLDSVRFEHCPDSSDS